MAAPLKPWERTGVNYQNSNTALPVNSMSGTPLGENRVQAALGGSASAASLAAPPQVPPRPSQQNTFQSRFGSGLGYGGYGGYSSPYAMGGFGGMYGSPYSTYSSFGPQHMGDFNSTFARQAEESSRPAFESIESIVHAVTSVGMMLDSTFQAVYNSFRAVIGVADNFSRLKAQMIQICSAVAVFRTLRYMYRKLLELLRLRPSGEADREWSRAFQEVVSTLPADGSPKKSSWPILLFFAMIMGGPYLIWKFISSFSNSKDENGWAKGTDDHFVGRTNFNFQGQGSEELSFSAGQNILVAPKELQPRVRGWLLASIDGSKTGMIPANYITVLGKRRGSRHTDSVQPPPLRQSDSGIALSQEAQLQSSSTEQMTPVPESDFDSEFGLAQSNASKPGESFNLVPDSSTQEAADILNSAEDKR